MQIGRKVGKKVNNFDSFKNVQQRIKERLKNEEPDIESVDFSVTKKFSDNEENRIQVVLNKNKDWEIFIPRAELQFWNGSYKINSNFDSIVENIKKRFYYYKSNGSI